MLLIEVYDTHKNSKSEIETEIYEQPLACIEGGVIKETDLNRLQLEVMSKLTATSDWRQK